MKRLYRSKNERILSGVCAGIGMHLDIDPTIIRLVWAVATIFSYGLGIIASIIAWIQIPEQEKTGNMDPASRLNRKYII